ncbi:hypothetical protein [Streptomyces sp. NPDC046887]|uniref:hypothetical protein n=1 Tax=Streptomyces sp. NPDC046887 TaxID=3155472 RepID=UPI0033F535FD
MKDGKVWVGDEVYDEATGSAAMVTDVRERRRERVYVLRPLFGPMVTWSTTDAERLALVRSREDMAPGWPDWR